MNDGIPFCTLCLAEDELHNEARWVIEVITPDGEVIQRLLADDGCVSATFLDMGEQPAQFETGNYSTLRRWMPSDAVLRIDQLAEVE